ncbi:MAG: hypothetical protein MZV65_19395 [Chromatiales bacterium]|nr:hypothetical protein [Chromatiales bacterium]
MSKLRFNSIWISDVHLGLRACKAEFLLDFLRHTECDTLYLVGDIIDFWHMKKGCALAGAAQPRGAGGDVHGRARHAR